MGANFCDATELHKPSSLKEGENPLDELRLARLIAGYCSAVRIASPSSAAPISPRRFGIVVGIIIGITANRVSRKVEKRGLKYIKTYSSSSRA